MLPKRRKHPRLGLREPTQIRLPAHLRFIRSHDCSIAGKPRHVCGGPIEAAHVRIGTDGGTGMKPGDNWALPLCSEHHASQHRIGEQSFEKRHGIDMKAIAAEMWLRSPAGIRYRKAQEQKP